MIEVEHLTIEFSDFSLKDIHIHIPHGEFFILLGPAGSGKTLILEAIAGIRPVGLGRIHINGRDMTDLPPEKRGVGIVYQDYALFPHMTVIENIRYGLAYHKHPPREHSGRIDDLMVQTGIVNLADRAVTHLSGGEKQRVALVRALAVHPSVLLLDEPLSALDPSFRDDIQKLLKVLHKSTGTTFLMVTHDFAEALFLGQRAAVLNNGCVEQTGSMKDIFNFPETPFVAGFMGMKNMFEGTFNGNRVCLDDGEFCLDMPVQPHFRYIAFRGEDVHMQKKPFPDGCVNTFHGRIIDIIDRGPYCEVSVQTGSLACSVFMTKGEIIHQEHKIDNDVFLNIPPSSIHAF